MANLCNIDGVLIAESAAVVPVLDRGFLFGDSIYEVVRTVGPVPVAWPEHWRRLQTSAAGILMALDLDEATVARRIAATLAAADHGDSYVRLIVTRGTGSAPNIDLATAGGTLRWVVLVRPLQHQPGRPARVALVTRLRNDRRALDPATKSGNYLNNVLGLAEAKAAGATDCLMLNTDGFVTEASTANVFARVGGVWCTPPLRDGLLAGITRQLLLEVLQELGEPWAERPLRADELRGADEVFLSSTLRDLSPVTELDGRRLCDDQGGPATRALSAAFARFVTTRHRTVETPHWRQLVDGA